METRTDLDRHEMSEGGLQEGVASLRGIKRKLQMSDETVYEPGFEQCDVHIVKPTGRLNEGEVIVWDFPSWQQAIRIFNGDFVVEFQIKKNDGTSFPANIEDFGDDNVHVRPNFFHNLWMDAVVIINGQPLELPLNYDQYARMMDLLTVDNRYEDYLGQKTGFGVYRALPLERVGATALNASLDKPMTPNTMPSTVKTISADAVAIADQKAYNDQYSKWLAGSPIIRLKGKIKNPFMTDSKFQPPEFPLKVRMKLHKPGQLFQCAPQHVPSVHLVNAYFLDYTYKLSPEMADRFASEIFKNDKQIVRPITRAVGIETGLPRGQTVYVNKVLTGVLPRKMVVAFIRNRAWKAESSTQNPYDYQYLGIKRFRVRYLNRTWPTREGYAIEGLTHGPPYTDDELKTIMQRNWTVYEDNMQVFAGKAKVNDLALTQRDWFTHSNLWSFDLTPLGISAELEHVAFPKMDGHLDFDIEFAEEPKDVYTIVVFAEYNNQYNISVPGWEVNRDW